MSKVDVMVKSLSAEDIKQGFLDDPYKITIESIKHNIAFDCLETGVQKALLSSFAICFFSYENCEPLSKGIALDGFFVPHDYLYSFIMASEDSCLEEIFAYHRGCVCPKSFVMKINDLICSV